jgi:two-component system, OmpR family, copper resistance phosphate regulon response regulator CusR
MVNRILIVEDEDRLAALLEKGLQKKGFNTAIAADGAKAVSMAKNDLYDLILLDIGLPIKNGWMVLEELEEQAIQIPVIIVSAYEVDRAKLTRLGHRVKDYIAKPFQFRDLLERVVLHIQN